MKKIWMCVFVLFSVVFAVLEAADNIRDFAPEEFFPGHLQGIAADESGIYWSCYDRILKTDWQGNKLLLVHAPKHVGDCAVRNGKLYVATSLLDEKAKKANQGFRCALLIYDCKTLKLLQTVPLKEIRGADGIVWHKNHLYIGNDEHGKQPHPETAVCIYDQDLKFLKTVRFKTGVPMKYGIQTLNLYEGKILAGFYSKPRSFLLEPETFRVVGTFPKSVNTGFAAVPESVFKQSGVICTGCLAGKKGKWHAQAAFYKKNVKSGKLVPFTLIPAKQKKAVLPSKTLPVSEPQRCEKISDSIPRKTLPVQTEKCPQDVKELPHKEFAPEFVPTEAERKAGMVLFSRPLTEAIWAESTPLPFERITELSGYGAQKQFVTLNFAVLPLRDLKNLKVRFTGNIQPELRLVRYWNIIYPKYSSHRGNPKDKYYQRMPEFLAPFTSGDFPAMEPQRFMLMFRLPSDAKEISGDVIVFHDDYDKALKLPLKIRILPFELKQDPKKNYSAYYYDLRRAKSPFYSTHKNDEQLLHQVQLAEFKKMVEYGFTRPPTVHLYPVMDKKKLPISFRIRNAEKLLPELKEAGFSPDAPLSVIGCANAEFYKKFTKHDFGGFHMENIDCSRIPESMYQAMGSALDDFLLHAKKNHYPPMIFNPIDEPCLKAVPHVVRVLKLFNGRKMKTFQTSPPAALIKQGGKYVNIYNYGSFAVPYKQAVSGDKYEYWCYPNDNAYQIKDPDVMCHGGRMTYGFGYWRSGFHNIIPWIWNANRANSRMTGGGEVMLCEDGTILMTTYWECFRLGVDDERYIYTLQDAIVKRENSADPQVQKVVRQAKTVLQNVWNAICPQPAYLRADLMHHAELDAHRAAIANALLELKKFPETSRKVASSVIIDSNGKYEAQKEFDGGAKITLPLENWQPVAKELTMEKIPAGMAVKVKIDHQLEGEDYGKKHYPMGWPRIRCPFPKPGIDFSRYSCIEFDLTVNSDRDIENDYKWPLSLTVYSRNGEKSGLRISTSLEPNIKHKIRLPLSKMHSFSREALKQVKLLQIVIREEDYPHGTNLNLKIENIRATGFAAPTITGIDAPALLALPCSGFSTPVSVDGVPEKEQLQVTAGLIAPDGKTVCEYTVPVIAGKALCGFPGTALKTGLYTVRCSLQNGSALEKKIRVINSPASE